MGDIITVSERKRYYLGIDGGATKTRFALCDENGCVLKKTTLGSSNLIDLGRDACFDVLRRGIDEVRGDLPYGEISVFAGVSGGTSGESQRQIADFLKTFGFFACGNGSDSENIIAAGLKERDGVAVIIGTGSCAFVKKGCATERIGGMGYLFDLAGSGYDVGAHGIAAALSSEDGTGNFTSIREKILRRTGKRSVLGSLGEFYAKGKTEIASYAPIVFEAYDEGDEIAVRIIRNNMKKIAVLIHAAGKRFDEDEVLVCFTGGLTKRFSTLEPYIREHLKTLGDRKRFTFEVLRDDPVEGALYKAGLPREITIC